MSGPETPDDTARVNQKTVGKVLKPSKRWNPRWLLAFIVVLTGALTLTLFIVARFYIKQPPEDTKAFIPGMLGILTLVVIAVQVWINQRQWVVTRDGLEKTQNLINQNERFIKASQRQARAAEKALRLAEYTLAEMKHSRELEYPAMLFIADVYLSDPLENEEGEPQRIKTSERRQLRMFKYTLELIFQRYPRRGSSCRVNSRNFLQGRCLTRTTIR